MSMPLTHVLDFSVPGFSFPGVFFMRDSGVWGGEGRDGEGWGISGMVWCGVVSCSGYSIVVSALYIST